MVLAESLADAASYVSMFQFLVDTMKSQPLNLPSMKIFKTLLTMHFFLFCTLAGWTQSEIVTIDGVYVERDSVDENGKTHSTSFRLNEGMITDGDVVVFDIPGLGDHLRASNRSVADLRLVVEDIEMAEYPAFAENLESGVVRFEFNQQDLTSEHRQALYNRPGGSTKNMRLGIKMGDANAINYSPKARIYFQHIDTWEMVGFILIAAFIWGLVRSSSCLRISSRSEFLPIFGCILRPWCGPKWIGYPLREVHTLT